MSSLTYAELKGMNEETNASKRSICNSCGKSAEVKLCMCSRCKIAKYCNRACQRNHWPAHKAACAKMVELNENGDKIAKDTEAWMNENSALVQCFMLNLLRAYGGPEMSLVGTHYAVLVGTYDVAYRMVQVTHYYVAEASIFEEKFANFLPSDKVYANVALVVNGTAKLRRVLDNPELLSSFGIVSEAVQLERAEKIFQTLKAARSGPKLSMEKVTRSIKRHAPETAAMFQRCKSVFNQLIMHAVNPEGQNIYSCLLSYTLRMMNPATTLKDTHRMLLRILCDVDNLRIVSCTAESIEKIASSMQNIPSGNSDAEFWRNGDEKDQKTVRESEKPNKVFLCVVHWKTPGAVDDEEGGILQQANFIYEEHIQLMEGYRQTRREQAKDLKLLIEWANQRPGTLPESSVPEEWKAPPANGGGYL